MGSIDNGENRAFLTGATGFIASHTLDHLLEEGFSVLAGVRSRVKGEALLGSIPVALRPRVTYVVVNDITTDGAFDEAIASSPPLTHVIHTQSPCHDNVQDPERDFLNPAIKGTTGILASVKKLAPSVKRVVVLSSSAAVINPKVHVKVYDDTFWAPMTWEEALRPERTYVASKIYAEKAAWAFMEEQKPTFDLAVINCSYVFGPVQRQLQSLETVNLTNQRIRDMLIGKMKDSLDPTAPVFTCVDVRDVAMSLVRAATVSKAGGNRFYVVGSYFSNKQLADILRSIYPELLDKLPPRDSVDDFPNDMYGFDVSKSKRLLGLQYIPLEKTVRDAADSILALERRSVVTS